MRLCRSNKVNSSRIKSRPFNNYKVTVSQNGPISNQTRWTVIPANNHSCKQSPTSRSPRIVPKSIEVPSPSHNFSLKRPHLRHQRGRCLCGDKEEIIPTRMRFRQVTFQQGVFQTKSVPDKECSRQRVFQTKSVPDKECSKINLQAGD